MRQYILITILVLFILLRYKYYMETFTDDTTTETPPTPIVLYSNKWNLVSFWHDIHKTDLDIYNITIYSLENDNNNNRWRKIDTDNDTLFANKGYFIYNNSGTDITINMNSGEDDS